jgi:hypothetical protein
MDGERLSSDASALWMMIAQSEKALHQGRWIMQKNLKNLCVKDSGSSSVATTISAYCNLPLSNSFTAAGFACPLLAFIT